MPPDAAAVAELKCPECSKPFKDPRGLGVHRRFAHGVKGQSQNAAWAREHRKRVPKSLPSSSQVHPKSSQVGLGKGPRGKLRAAVDARATLRQALDAVAAEIDRLHAEQNFAIDGLESILENAKALRLAYIKKSVKFNEILREAEFLAESADSPDPSKS